MSVKNGRTNEPVTAVRNFPHESETRWSRETHAILSPLVFDIDPTRGRMDVMSADDPPGGFTEMNATEIAIVDRGRGLQLSTSRITVQDLVPYFQDGCSYDEISRWIPSLSHEEIAVVERYYREHQAEMDDQDRRIKARTEERVRLQRLRFPDVEVTREERLERLRSLLHRSRQEANGEGHPG